MRARDVHRILSCPSDVANRRRSGRTTPRPNLAEAALSHRNVARPGWPAIGYWPVARRFSVCVWQPHAADDRHPNSQSYKDGGIVVMRVTFSRNAYQTHDWQYPEIDRACLRRPVAASRTHHSESERSVRPELEIVGFQVFPVHASSTQPLNPQRLMTQVIIHQIICQKSFTKVIHANELAVLVKLLPVEIH